MYTTSEKEPKIMRYLILLLLMGFAHADLPALKVGMQLQDPPFEMRSPDGKPAGISVEFAYALGTYLNRPIVIQDLPFVGLIPALQSGNIDCIISSMSVTKERMASIDFSQPYITTGLALLISAKSKVKSIKDVDENGKVVVVKKGTTGELYALTNLDHAQVLSLAEEAACVLEVIQGKADVFIYDLFSIEMVWKKNLATTRANLTPFRKEEWAIGLRQNDPLKKEINAFIKQFVGSGKMQKLIDRYYVP